MRYLFWRLGSNDMNPRPSLFHQLLHLLQLNTGTVETWWEPNINTADALMVGFKCTVCGKMSGVHRSRYW